jgi:hypothetical protein
MAERANSYSRGWSAVSASGLSPVWRTRFETRTLARQLGAQGNDALDYHFRKRSVKPLPKQLLDIHLAAYDPIVQDANSAQLRARAVWPPVVVPV